ncbi:hypothetical protein [Maridesulfovibrio sp. FT414]|uniref:hypothetical protein n=1 Tax=Maridesulfovibrio sp. FT414 TaxID=2979469 RepID=UPI003D8021D8
MSEIMLQICGGLCYLLNKVFFSRAERATSLFNRKSWRIRSWIVYLVGLPAWVVVFVSEHNWIAAAVESGGAPAMVSGLIVAWRGQGAAPRWLDTLAKLSVFAGLGVSMYEYGGLTDISQVLELGIAAGFLLGTYLMAQDSCQGYLWLMLGNISCAALMGTEGFYILMGQQLTSLIFVVDGFLVRRKRC